MVGVSIDVCLMLFICLVLAAVNLQFISFDWTFWRARKEDYGTIMAMNPGICFRLVGRPQNAALNFDR